MTRHEIEFYECETGQDLETYVNDLRECGASIASTDVNYHSEVAKIVYFVSDDKSEDFIKKFIKTYSYDYVN